MSRSGGKKWNDEDNLTALGKSTLNRVNNGSCRNAIVISCGSCGARQRTRGLAPIIIRTKKKMGAAQLRIKSDTTHGPPAEDGKRQECNFAGLNFVQLSTSKPNSTTQLQHSTPIKPSLGGGKSSKAKKGQEKQKSGLLDFLSSLND
jgi:hypothetical protein